MTWCHTVIHKLIKLYGHPVTVEFSGWCFDGGSWWKEKLQHADSPSYGHWEESPNASPGAFSSWRYFFELLQSEEIISHELFRLDHVDSTSSNHDRGPAAEWLRATGNTCCGWKQGFPFLPFFHPCSRWIFDGFPLKMSLDLPLPKFLSLSTLKVLLYHGGGRGSQGFLRSFWKWLTNIVFHPAGSQHVWESNEAVSPDCHCQCGVLG